MNRSTELKIAELKKELAAAKEEQGRLSLEAQSTAEENKKRIADFFANRYNASIYALRTISQEWSSNQNQKIWTLKFGKDENMWGQITATIIIENTDCELKTFSYPSNTAHSMEEVLEFGKGVTHISETILHCGQELAIEFECFKQVPRFEQARTVYNIQQEIEAAQESGRIQELDIRAGRTVYIATNGHKKRYGYGWKLCTITKVNTKTVKYVINYENGSTSGEYAIPKWWNLFKTVEEYNIVNKVKG